MQKWSPCAGQSIRCCNQLTHLFMCKEHAPMMHYTYTRRWEQNNSYVTKGYSLDLSIHERQ